MVSDRAFVFHMHVLCDKDLYIEAVYFEILTLGFDDDGHLWNLPRTGAFVFHNTSCLCILRVCLLSEHRPKFCSPSLAMVMSPYKAIIKNIFV
jgi:hypothetical protein